MPGPVCIESRVELFVALVEASQQQRTKMEIPDPVVDLLEPDVLVDQRMADVEPALLPADSAVSTDAPDLEVAGVLHARYYGGKRAAVRPGKNRRAVSSRCFGGAARY